LKCNELSNIYKERCLKNYDHNYLDNKMNKKFKDTILYKNSNENFPNNEKINEY
jgi:hypothetical protein